MIQIIALYISSHKDCYSQMTQLNLLQDDLEVLLFRLPKAECDFPSGVMVQLQFSDPLLNIGQIFTNFNYNKTNKLLIPCTSCERYDALVFASILIDSPQLTTIISVGSILNIRKQNEPISKGVVFSYSPTKQCVVINKAEIGKYLVDKQVTLTVVSDLYGTKEYLDFNVNFNVGSTEYCFATSLIIDYVNTVSLHLVGLKKGIQFSQIFSTSEILILGQPAIMAGLQSTIYSNFQFIGIQQINPAYDDFIKTINIQKITFVAQYRIGHNNYYISGKLNPKLVNQFGNLICDATDIPGTCKDIMKQVQAQPFTERKSRIFFHFENQVVLQDVTSWTASCFNTLQILVKQNQLILDYNYEATSSDTCKLITGEKVQIEVGFFRSESQFVDAINGFTLIQKFDNIWNSIDSQIIFHIGKKEYKKFADMKNYLYKGIFIKDSKGNFVDQIEAERVDINLFEQLIFFICLCVIVSLAIISAVFYLRLIPIRTRSIKKISIKDDISQ